MKGRKQEEHEAASLRLAHACTLTAAGSRTDGLCLCAEHSAGGWGGREGARTSLVAVHIWMPGGEGEREAVGGGGEEPHFLH